MSPFKRIRGGVGGLPVGRVAFLAIVFLFRSFNELNEPPRRFREPCLLAGSSQ